MKQLPCSSRTARRKISPRHSPPFNRRKHPQTTTKQQSRPAERVQLRKTAAAPLSRAAASAIRWFPPEKPIAPYIPRMPLPPASLPNTAPSRSPLHWRMAFRQYITSSRPSRQKASPLRFRKPAFPAAPTQKILPFSAVHRKRSCISFWTKPVSQRSTPAFFHERKPGCFFSEGGTQDVISPSPDTLQRYPQSFSPAALSTATPPPARRS